VRGVAVAVTIKYTDKGANKLLQRLLKKGALSVGILESGGTYQDNGGPASQMHEAKDETQRIKDVFAGFGKDGRPLKKKNLSEYQKSRKNPGTALTIGEIAAIHEFGLGSCPRRSFLAGWVDENGDKIRQVVKAGAAALVSGKLSSPLQFLNQVGGWSVGQIQQRMAANIPPPLAPETIKRKGSSVALIDTGQLRSSITYRIDAVETISGAKVSKGGGK